MRFKLSTDSLSTVSADLIAIPVHQDDLDASWAFRSIDKALDGRLAEAAREEGFRGGREKSISVNTGGRIDARRVFVVGLGTKSGDQMVALRIAAFKAAQEARRSAAKHVAIAIPRLPVSHTESAMENLAIGVVLGSYRYGEYKRPSKPFPTKEVTVVLRGAKARAAARAALDTGAFTGDCVNRARDLVNGPANDVTPTHLANVAKGIAAKHQGLKVKILNRKACEKLGMGLYLAVAQGSQAEPRFIHLTYTPPRGALGTLGLIGKGVTFDSGGLSLKPPKSMEDMKTDMAGGAAVISAMAAIARAKPPIRVHAVCAATENMPSGHAYRPGDVYTGMNGRSVEVLNTDAEGRLTLADAIHYMTQQKVDEIVELSTLTGACIVALGRYTAGVMSKHDDLAESLLGAAASAGEDFWRLPLTERIAAELDSNIADCKNIGGGYGGAISAGHFLLPFAGNTPFVHCDIAGPSSADAPWDFHPKGGTGVGVMTLVEYATRTLPARLKKKSKAKRS